MKTMVSGIVSNNWGTVIQSANNSIESQLAAYITNAINYTFTESHIKRADTKDKVVMNFTEFTQSINIEKLYLDQKQKMEKLIRDRNYTELIKIVNNKGLISCVSKAFNYEKQKDYIEKALSYLKEEETGRIVLKSYFPKCLN